MSALLALLAAAAFAAAPPAGWVKQGASLLYFDEIGNLVSETPLRSDEEPAAGGKVNVHEIRGGATANNRFGWTFERTTTWNTARTKQYASRRLLRVFGSGGKELWSSSEADTPETGEAIQFSADGETLLVASRTDKGWTVAAKTYMGSTITDVGPVPRLQDMLLRPNGKYAQVRWVVPEQSATHTFLDIPNKARKDIPSNELWLGSATIDDEGKVTSGKKVVFKFETAPKDPFKP